MTRFFCLFFLLVVSLMAPINSVYTCIHESYQARGYGGKRCPECNHLTMRDTNTCPVCGSPL